MDLLTVLKICTVLFFLTFILLDIFLIGFIRSARKEHKRQKRVERKAIERYSHGGETIEED